MIHDKLSWLTIHLLRMNLLPFTSNFLIQYNTVVFSIRCKFTLSPSYISIKVYSYSSLSDNDNPHTILGTGEGSFSL